MSYANAFVFDYFCEILANFIALPCISLLLFKRVKMESCESRDQHLDYPFYTLVSCQYRLCLMYFSVAIQEHSQKWLKLLQTCMIFCNSFPPSLVYKISCTIASPSQLSCSLWYSLVFKKFRAVSYLTVTSTKVRFTKCS